MSFESKKVVRFCVQEGICTRCKCKPARKDSRLCAKCCGYILTMRNSSIAKLLLVQHEAVR